MTVGLIHLTGLIRPADRMGAGDDIQVYIGLAVYMNGINDIRTSDRRSMI